MSKNNNKSNILPNEMSIKNPFGEIDFSASFKKSVSEYAESLSAPLL